jgi:hypothetical protein
MSRRRTDSPDVLVRRRDEVQVVIEPRVIGLEVATAVYGLSADTLRRLQDEEGMPVIKMGARRLVPVAATDEWFAARIERREVAA